MWTRVQLKEKAKAALKVNYWKMVLVSLILSLLVGGAGSSGATSSYSDTSDTDPKYEDDLGYGDGYDYEDDVYYEVDMPSLDEIEDILGEDLGITEEEYENAMNSLMEDPSSILIFLGIFLIVFVIIMLIVIVISLVMAAFISNPIEVGCNRFFLKALDEPAQVKEVAFAFDNSYKNVVKIMFYRTLYTMLWTCLFIIPGIIKSYEYRMIPYLLAENPNLTKEQAFALSKQMMMGQKWSAYVLDLSFIGWHLLSICTVGILEIFYVAPYVYATNAALYEELSSVYGRPAMNTYVTAPYQPVGVYENVNPYATSGSYVAPEQPDNEQEIYNEE